ncbi:MAG: peptidylprolyl isomerase [Gammaproteobacteria bacterium]|nr:peptidylprolyl isomerase [Gammaproteobacteria bacterium]
MNNFTLSTASILLATLLSNSAFALDKNTVAAVNGKKVTQKQYQTYLKQLQARNPKGKQAPLNRQLILNELINREVLLQEAKKLKLHKDKKVAALIEQQKNNILIQALLSKSPAAKPVKEKELKAFYDKEIVGSDPKEYKARQIQVKDEAKAKEIIKKLNDGANFEEVAKEESVGISKKDGGDLGWFATEAMPPALAKAIKKQKLGTHSQKPIKTQYGYHIIKLEDSRKRQMKSFDDVKNQIQQLIQNQRLKEYVIKLRNKAKIEVK